MLFVIAAVVAIDVFLKSFTCIIVSTHRRLHVASETLIQAAFTQSESGFVNRISLSMLLNIISR